MPDNTAPYEVIAGSAELWLAPVGEAFPDVDAEPAGNWAKVGTTGDQNYGEEGVSVTHRQSLEYWRALGSAGPSEVFRIDEDVVIRLTLVDLSLEQYTHVLNENTVTTTPAAIGTPGVKSIGLSRGLTVTERALLLRFASAYGDGFQAQYQIPVAVEEGTPEVIFRKSAPAGLAVQFHVLEDPNAASAAERFGLLVVQTAPALNLAIILNVTSWLPKRWAFYLPPRIDRTLISNVTSWGAL